MRAATVFTPAKPTATATVLPLLLLLCSSTVMVADAGKYTGLCDGGGLALTPALYEQGYEAYKDAVCVPDYAFCQRPFGDCPDSPGFTSFRGDVNLTNMGQLEYVGAYAFYQFGARDINTGGKVIFQGSFPKLKRLKKSAFHMGMSTDSLVKIVNAPALEFIEQQALSSYKGRIEITGRFPMFKGFGGMVFQSSKCSTCLVAIECRGAAWSAPEWTFSGYEGVRNETGEAVECDATTTTTVLTTATATSTTTTSQTRATTAIPTTITATITATATTTTIATAAAAKTTATDVSKFAITSFSRAVTDTDDGKAYSDLPVTVDEADGARARLDCAAGDTYRVAPITTLQSNIRALTGNSQASLEYALAGAPNGFFMGPKSAEILAIPTELTVNAANLSVWKTAQIIATDPSSGLNAVVQTIEIRVRSKDQATPANGPNNQTCLNGGTPIDTIPFNNEFACNCSNTRFTVGDNCDREPPVAASTNTERCSAAAVVVLAILLVLAVGGAAYLGFQLRETSRELQVYRKPHTSAAGATMNADGGAIVNAAYAEPRARVNSQAGLIAAAASNSDFTI